MSQRLYDLERIAMKNLVCPFLFEVTLVIGISPSITFLSTAHWAS
jgi:hypothetical protein